MKKVAIYSVLGFVLIGCSGKEPLTGIRKDIILSEVQKDEMDDTPVVMDQSSSVLGKNLQLLWQSSMDYESSESLRMIAPVVFANGKIFSFDAGGLVYAFDAETGKQIWRKTTTLKGKDGQVGGAISYGDGKVIVTSSFSEAFAFDENNGEMLWRIKLPACCKGDGITIADGKVYMLCDNSSLQVVDIRDGKFLWSHSGMTMDTTYIGSAGVIVQDEIVYLAYPSGEVFALLGNGSVLWSAMLSKFSFVNAGESFSHPRACPVIKGSLIYFTSANQQLTAFDTSSGTVVWRKDLGGLESPLVSGNSLFVQSSPSELVCVNKDNGKVKWTRKLKSGSNTVAEWLGPLQSGEDLLMLSSDGVLIRVSALNGSIKSFQHLNDFAQKVTARPIISGNTLYFVSDDGSVLAYRAEGLNNK